MKLLVCWLIVLYTCLSCTREDQLQLEIIPDLSGKTLNGTVLISGSTSTNYTSIQEKKNYLSVIDYKNDSVFRIFNLQDTTCIFAEQKKNITHPLSFLHASGVLDDNCLYLFESETNLVNEITLPKTKKDTVKLIKTELPHLQQGRTLPLSSDYHVTQNGVYAVDMDPDRVAGYYFFNPDKGYQFANAHTYFSPKISRFPALYQASLAANRKKRIITTASRYTNTIQFYDSDTNSLFKVIRLGKKLIEPTFSPQLRKLIFEESIKCFIEVHGTKKHIYYLYSGSVDFSAHSLIFKLNWKGSLIDVYHLDRSISSFAINEKETCLWGISRNQEGGTDVIKYSI